MSLLGTSSGSGSDTIDGSSLLRSSQSSPAACDTLETSTASATSVEQPIPYYPQKRRSSRTSRKRRFNHTHGHHGVHSKHRSVGYIDDMKMSDYQRQQNHPRLQRRRRTAPIGTHRLTNDSNNNYYSRIRFSRQSQDFLDEVHYGHLEVYSLVLECDIVSAMSAVVLCAALCTDCVRVLSLGGPSCDFLYIFCLFLLDRCPSQRSQETNGTLHFVPNFPPQHRAHCILNIYFLDITHSVI